MFTRMCVLATAAETNLRRFTVFFPLFTPAAARVGVHTSVMKRGRTTARVCGTTTDIIIILILIIYSKKKTIYVYNIPLPTGKNRAMTMG